MPPGRNAPAVEELEGPADGKAPVQHLEGTAAGEAVVAAGSCVTCCQFELVTLTRARSVCPTASDGFKRPTISHSLRMLALVWLMLAEGLF